VHTPAALSIGLLTLAGNALAQLAAAPCFDSNLGTHLALGIDQVATGIALGFPFPGPAGPVSSIGIGSNGFVWLAPTINPACCDGDEAGFLSDLPRIGAMWLALDPTRGNGVFFRSVPGSGGAPARAVITWDAPEGGTSGPSFLVQLQLLADGAVVIFHGPTAVATSHSVLAGITDGNGATPDRIDLSLLTTTFDTGSNPTVYDWMQYRAPPTHDLAGRSFAFVPNGHGGYLCSERTQCRNGTFRAFGRGCPQPSSFYESFLVGANPLDLTNQSILFVPNGTGGWVAVPGSGQFFSTLANHLFLVDDDIAAGLVLPFTWQHPAGATNVIDVDSNGCVYPVPGSVQTSRCCSSPALFMADPPSIAVLWEDLFPAGGGGVYFDIDPNGQAAYVTWNNVPEYNNGGSNTAQLALFPNGTFELRYGAVANIGHDVIVGYTVGSAAPDPGSRDLTALPWNTGTVGVPLTLAAAAGSHPQIGATFTLQLSNIQAGTSLCFLVVGFQSAAIDLFTFGAPGCTGLVDFLLPGSHTVLTFLPTGPTTPFGLQVPNNQSLLGLLLYTQAATLTPAINPLGIVASNAGRLELGH